MDIHHFEKIQSYLPVNLLSMEGFVGAYVVVLMFILVRYFGLVGVFYYFFWNHKGFRLNPLHNQRIKPHQVRFEIFHSLTSSLVFAFFGVVMGILWQNGLTQMYLDFDHFGYAYLAVSFLIISLFHEVYFYFTHRMMHIPKYFKTFHSVHHYSHKTTPWASFSFNFSESVVQALFLPMIVLLIPVHPVVLIAYLTFMTLTAISNHLGFELIDSKWVRRYFISGQHHHRHHDQFNGNFGLYYCFMDRLMGTEIKGPEVKETK